MSTGIPYYNTNLFYYLGLRYAYVLNFLFLACYNRYAA
jgi:hypothetical protein